MKEKKSSYFTATWKMLAAVIIGGNRRRRVGSHL